MAHVQVEHESYPFESVPLAALDAPLGALHETLASCHASPDVDGAPHDTEHEPEPRDMAHPREGHALAPSQSETSKVALEVFTPSTRFALP